MYRVTLGPYGFYWFELLEHHPELGAVNGIERPR